MRQKKFEIRKELALDATPEQVWDAIATGPGLTAWFAPMEIDPDSETVVAWEPGKRLAIQTPQAEDGSTQAFEYLIEARDEGSTVLRFVHSGFLGDDWSDEFESSTGMGWDMYLNTLAQYLTHFAGRPAVYVEAESPSSGQPGTWARLLAAFQAGTGGRPVELGTDVHLDLPGLGAIDGEVDYLSSNFVGLRTADALIRVHGRAPIDTTVAVSHHAYGSDLDVRAATQAWESWLADLVA
ncbi:MAG: SRPBCC family protein [Acidimicrobiales bacterium]